uniref:Uncharacterized protein n=1 Tax=Pseudo-nitzschia arenysensis TaxID=697910 RepID=A0A7R9ZTK6_9STRA
MEQLAQPGDQTGAALAVGRPVAEYYEPWSSGTNFAFFQTAEFKPKHIYSWEVAILPINSGLETNGTLSTDDLNAVVNSAIDANPTLSTIKEVEVVEIPETEKAEKKSGMHLRFVKDTK